jgi:hypothetical protein
MSSKIIEHLQELKILAATSNSREQIRLTIRKAEEPLLRCIQEIALNILQSNVPISAKEYLVLSKYKSFIRNIGKKYISKRKLKKLILSQTNVIPYLLRPALRVYKIPPFYSSRKQYDNRT